MEREERGVSRVTLCGRLPKPVPQRLCGCPKETLVGADRHELDSLFKVAASVRFHGGKDADRAPMAPSAGKDIPHCCLHLGVAGVSEMPKGSGEGGRADKEAVHTLDGANAIEIFHAGT